MVQFVADQSFWELFPDAKLGVVLLKDVQNQGESPEDVKQLLADSHELAKAYLTADNFSDNQVVQVYRKAYQQFKTKKGARSSIEALDQEGQNRLQHALDFIEGSAKMYLHAITSLHVLDKDNPHVPLFTEN